MQGLIQKGRALFLGNAHAVLDAATDANSIPVLEQHIRDLGKSREDMQATVARANYQYDTANSNLTAHDASMKSLENDIRTLTAANGGNPNENQLRERGILLTKYQKLSDGRAEEAATVEELRKTAEGLKSGCDDLMAKETELRSKIAKLRMVDSTAKTMGAAASSLTSAKDVMDGIGDFDSAEDKIKERGAVAGAAFNNALASMGSSSKPTEIEKLKQDDLLASILGNKQAAAA